MTTPLHKTNAHEKARTISSGFWELTNTSVLIPQQELACKRTSLRSMMKHHENDNSTPVSEIASVRAAKCDKSKSLWPANRWRAE